MSHMQDIETAVGKDHTLLIGTATLNNSGNLVKTFNMCVRAALVQT